jgi:hypothetical protein
MQFKLYVYFYIYSKVVEVRATGNPTSPRGNYSKSNQGDKIEIHEG